MIKILSVSFLPAFQMALGMSWYNFVAYMVASAYQVSATALSQARSSIGDGKPNLSW